MAQPIQSASIAAPGFFGLNTQESSITLESGFALVADNCIIDKYGRLGARKGWRYLTSGSTGIDLQGAHRFVDVSGDPTIISWSDTKFYTGIGTLTEVVPTTANTLNVGNWQAATLNDKCYFFQRGKKPMVYDAVTDAITDIEDAYANYIDPATGSAFATDTAYGAHIPSANTVLSAYGRLWVADTSGDKMTVYWSDLLDGEAWLSGSSGSIDLSAILVQGTDEIVGIGAQNGQLLVFCKRSIVIFDDNTGGASFDPATMRLVEVINRVGCVARDSIQNTGVDIFFLSEDGLRSLGRVIQEKSLPMRDLSANIRDDLVGVTAVADAEAIRSIYSEDNAFYLLLFPSYSRIYCFDTRAPLQNGALRVTIWDNQTQTNMLSLPNTIYFTQADGIAEYATYQDNTSKYNLKYYTNYFDFGNASQFKILKRITTTVIGGSEQKFIVKAGFDYRDAYQSFSASLAKKETSQYNIDEYGLSTTTTAVSQGANTVSVETYNTSDVLISTDHYTVDFQTTEDLDYNVPTVVWLDSDTYYYSTDTPTPSRTRTIVYTKVVDYTSIYEGGTLVEVIRTSSGGTGNVLQIGFEANVDGAELSIQKMDIFVKQGRVY